MFPYTALNTYENETKIGDIENSITESILANSNEERNKQSFLQEYKYYIIIIIVFITFVILIWWLFFHVI